MRIHRLFSTCFILLLFFIFAWGVAGWYFGTNAESRLREYLAHSQNMAGEKIFRSELLEYKKNLFGATARLRVFSDISLINERLGDFAIDAQLLNGPLLINRKGIEFGTSRWRFRIDEKSMDVSQAEYLNSLFPKQLPSANVRFDFENKAYYQANLNSQFAGINVQGIYDLDSDENQGEVLLLNVRFAEWPNQVRAKQARIRYHHDRNIAAEFKPGTVRIRIPDLEISYSKLKQPVHLGLTLSSELSVNKQKDEDYLNGHIVIDMSQLSANNGPVDDARLTLQFDNINAQGLLTLSDTYADLDNLRQQAHWVLEESGELPEGQDQLWQIRDQLNIKQNQFIKRLGNEVFNPDKSSLRIMAYVNNGNKQSTLKGQISLNKDRLLDANQATVNILNAGHLVDDRHIFNEISGGEEALLKLMNRLQGEASVTLENGTYKALKKLVPLFASLNKTEFQLYLAQGKLQIKDKR